MACKEFYYTDQELTNAKLELWLGMTDNKITGFTYKIPNELHQAFKKKCAIEGFSLQEGIARLIEAFVSERFVMYECDNSTEQKGE